MTARRIPPPSSRMSARQRSIQQRASRLPFQAAVRLAADALFGFTHRASRGKALWSDTVHVWLGNTTFLYWAMHEDDIPRLVANTAGAPESEDELHEAVRAVLVAYWADYLVSLPSKSAPQWLPLP